MEARRSRWLAAVIAAGTLTVPPAAAAQEVSLIGELRDAQQRTEALCLAADGVQDIDTKAARRLYLRALSTGARNSRCAASGLTQLADAAKAKAAEAPLAIDKAAALIANGFHAQADELLTDLLAEDPEATIPNELQPDDRALATAEALWAQGYETEAQEQVQAALAADAHNTVPAELQKAERKPMLVRQAIGWLGGGLITAAIIGGLIVLALWLVRVIRDHSKRRIVVEAFSGGSEGAGAALQAEMQDRFYAWTKGTSARRMLTASAGTDQGMSLPTSLKEVAPQTGTLVELVNSLDRFLPNRTWIIDGQFLPADPHQGVGLALRLYRKSNGKILDSDTLRQAEFQAWPVPATNGDAEVLAATKLAYQRLAIGGAAFLLYADRGQRKVFEDVSDSLGTKKWRSYAMANSAATYYPGEPQVARELYRRALKHDSTYRDARFGMAVIDLDRAEGDGAKLQQVEGELKTVAKGLDAGSGLWYRAKFWLIVSLMYRQQDEAAHAVARELFGADTHWWKPRSKLKPFLDEHRPNMLVIAAAALRRDSNAAAPDALASHLRSEFPDLPPQGPVRGDDIVAQLERDPGRWPAAYNLAGYYALVKPDNNTWIASSLSHLETALDADGLELARYAWRDWSLKSLRDDAEMEFRALLADADYVPV